MGMTVDILLAAGAITGGLAFAMYVLRTMHLEDIKRSDSDVEREIASNKAVSAVRYALSFGLFASICIIAVAAIHFGVI